MNSRKQHILFLLTGLYVGGAEQHTLSLINGLDPERFEFSVVYLKPAEGMLDKYQASRALRVQALPVKGRIDRQAGRQLATWCETWRVDQIVAVDPFPMFFAYVAGLTSPRIRSTPLHEVLHMTDLPGAYQELQYQLIYRFIYARIAGTVFVSEKQRTHWHAKGLRSPKVAVIRNGVDPSRFDPILAAKAFDALPDQATLRSDIFTIGICASLRPEKKHEDLFAALALLKKQGVAARVMVIGDGARRAELEACCDRLGVRSDVLFVGSVSDVRPYIHCCDIVTLVSHHVETFSIAILEAMAMGKPVVASDIGGASEQITPGEHGHLFQPGDIGGLARILVDMANNKTLRINMGQAARSRVLSEFTMDKMLDSYAQYLA
jgi:glycosyltransferase involved in cell wall biosynthesis